MYHAADKKTPDILYHYCSLSAFKGMLNSKRIWLSNVFYMNDKLEHLWLRNLVRDHIKESTEVRLIEEEKRTIDLVLSSTWPDDIFCLCLSEEI